MSHLDRRKQKKRTQYSRSCLELINKQIIILAHGFFLSRKKEANFSFKWGFEIDILLSQNNETPRRKQARKRTNSKERKKNLEGIHAQAQVQNAEKVYRYIHAYARLNYPYKLPFV